MQKSTHELALSGMFCALAVGFLWLSGILPLATYCWPILASFTLVPVQESCRKSYAWGSFAVGAFLSLLLCADKEAALVYCFLGYYPLLKPKIDKVSHKVLRFLAKLALCISSMGILYVLLIFVFQLDQVVQEFRQSAPLLLIATCVLGLFLFIVYDLALTRLSQIYKSQKMRKS